MDWLLELGQINLCTFLKRWEQGKTQIFILNRLSGRVGETQYKGVDRIDPLNQWEAEEAIFSSAEPLTWNYFHRMPFQELHFSRGVKRQAEKNAPLSMNECF